MKTLHTTGCLALAIAGFAFASLAPAQGIQPSPAAWSPSVIAVASHGTGAEDFPGPTTESLQRICVRATCCYWTNGGDYLACVPKAVVDAPETPAPVAIVALGHSRHA